MTEEEKLAKAYFVLGIEAGSSLDEINERWRTLAMVWHSDRFPSEEKKKKADEELKKINDARDILKKHFAENHKKTGSCACRPGAKTSQSTPPPNQPDNRAEEEAARKRNAERAAATAAAAKKAADEAAAEQARKNAQAAAEAAAQASVKNAVDQQNRSDEETLRWRISIGIGAAWILLSLFSIASLGIEHVWHNIAFSLEQRFAKHDDPAPQTNAETTTETSTAPVQAPPPDPALDQISEQNKRDEEARKQKTVDIWRYQNDVDRAQKVIDHCNNTIAELEAQIANPAVGDSEKSKLIGYQNQQKNYLSQAQMDFNTAQKMLADLTGKPTPTAIEIAPHVVPQPSVVGPDPFKPIENPFRSLGTNSQTAPSSDTPVQKFTP